MFIFTHKRNYIIFFISLLLVSYSSMREKEKEKIYIGKINDIFANIFLIIIHSKNKCQELLREFFKYILKFIVFKILTFSSCIFPPAYDCNRCQLCYLIRLDTEKIPRA